MADSGQNGNSWERQRLSQTLTTQVLQKKAQEVCNEGQLARRNLLFGADVAGAGTLILLSGGLASLILGPVLWAGISLILLRGAGATTTVRPGIRASSA